MRPTSEDLGSENQHLRNCCAKIPGPQKGNRRWPGSGGNDLLAKAVEIEAIRQHYKMSKRIGGGDRVGAIIIELFSVGEISHWRGNPQLGAFTVVEEPPLIVS